MKSIRQSYLSTAHAPRRKQYARAGAASASADKDAKYLSDTQRNEIDAQAKLSIHQLKDAIEKLGAAEQVRQETQTQVALKKRAKQGLGALGRWAAGGAITAKSAEEEIEEAKANTIREHRKGILWTLDFQLEQCVLFQTDMMEIRHMREVEKSKSVLYKTRATGPASSDYSGMDESHKAGDYQAKSTYNPDESSAVIENQLDPEQLQLFAQENQDMLKQYEDQLDKVRYVLRHTRLEQLLTPAVQPKSRSWRSRSCTRRSRPTSACRRRTSTSSLKTRSIQRRTLEVETRSSSARRSGAVRRRSCSGLQASSARRLLCGTCSYESGTRCGGVLGRYPTCEYIALRSVSIRGALSGPSFQKQQWQPCGVGILEPAASLQAMQTHNGS